MGPVVQLFPGAYEPPGAALSKNILCFFAFVPIASKRISSKYKGSLMYMLEMHMHFTGEYWPWCLVVYQVLQALWSSYIPRFVHVGHV